MDELKTAKSDKSDIIAVWVDIANVYGSVPHQLIFFALEQYGVSQHWIKIIKLGYRGLWSLSFSNNSSSSWHKHSGGNFTGCTSSIVLFWSPMSKITEYICAGALKLIRSEPPSIEAFMDDLFLKSTTLNATQEHLKWANTALAWARTALKPAKSRFLVLTNGKLQQDMKLYVSESNLDVPIPSTSNQQVKFFGRTISFTISDKDQMDIISSAVSKGLALINKFPHRGVHKVWILQHFLVPQLCWPLLIYEIPISAVLHLEQKISCYIWI